MFGTILGLLTKYGPTVLTLLETYGPQIISAIENHGPEVVSAIKKDGPALVAAVKPLVANSAADGSLGDDLSGVIQGATAILNSGSLQTLEGLAGMFSGIGAATSGGYAAGDPSLPARDPAGSSRR